MQGEDDEEVEDGGDELWWESLEGGYTKVYDVL